MSTVELRAAAASDLPAILRGERRYMEDIEPDSLASWSDAIDRNLALWIAQLGRTVILLVDGAHAGYGMWMASDGDALLITVNVLPEHRSQGYGALLVQWYMEDAQAAGFTSLRLGVHRQNPAQRIYARLGFQRGEDDGDYQIYRLDLA